MSTNKDGKTLKEETAATKKGHMRKVVVGLVVAVALCVIGVILWQNAGKASEPEPAPVPPYAENLEVKVIYDAYNPETDGKAKVVIKKEDGEEVASGLYSLNATQAVATLPEGRYVATVAAPILADGTILVDPEPKAFEVVGEECTEEHDHETAHTSELSVVLVPLPIEQYTDEAIAKAASIYEEADRAKYTEAAAAKMKAYQDQKAAEEAAIAAGQGSRDASGSYVPNNNSGTGTSSGGGAGSGSSGNAGNGGSSGNTGGGQTIIGWKTITKYTCNQCGAVFWDYASINAHHQASLAAQVGPPESRPPLCGGYTMSSWQEPIYG